MYSKSFTDQEFDALSDEQLENLIYFTGDGQGDVSVTSFFEMKDDSIAEGYYEGFSNSEIRNALYKEVANANMTEYVWVDHTGWYRVEWR